MAVRVRCSNCKKLCQVQTENIGRQVRCALCNEIFVATAEPEAPPAAPVGFWAGLKGMVKLNKEPMAKLAEDETEPTLDLDGPAVAAFTAGLPGPSEAARRPRLDIGCATSTGKVRSRNEDSYGIQHLSWANLDKSHELALLIVADGMGGYGGGDRASALVVQHIVAGFAQIFASGPLGALTPAQAAEALDRSIHVANGLILQQAYTDPACHGMGSTAAVAVIVDADVCLGHVGDCRVYHFTGGKLTQVTKDQTLVARMVELGKLTPQEAMTHPQRNEVTQAVGKHGDIQPGVGQLTIAVGDWLIIACDGLHAHVDAPALAAALAAAPPSAGALAQHLVDLANRGGGTDNCTVVAVRCW